jgi:hypothetical protein
LDSGITLLQTSLLLTLFLAISLGVLLSLYQARVAETKLSQEFQQLADMLASRASLASLGSIVPVDLPLTVEGQKYLAECRKEGFVIQVLTGKMKGRRFFASSPVQLVPRQLEPGARVYMHPTKDGIVISDYPVLEPSPKSPYPEQPPEFYRFSKSNPEISAFALWCYFQLGEEATHYCENIVKVGASYLEPIAELENEGMLAWVIKGTREVSAPPNLNKLPSVKEAENSGWLLSPKQALAEIRAREWKNEENDTVLVPENASIIPSVVFTKMGKFVAWRIAWDNYLIYSRALLWWWKETSPGFVYFSAKLRI